MARRDASAATGGDILMTRLMVRGVAGVVTDGGLRDSPTIEKLPWPAYCAARSAPLNLVRHHAVDAQVPVGCGGVPVYPGDIVVGDAEGVVVIPRHLADEVARDGAEQEQLESWILKEVKSGRGIFGLYPPDDEARTLRACRSADTVIWCTPAMQAWKASELRTWLALPPAMRQRGVLAVTFMDALPSKADAGRLLARLAADAGPHFRRIVTFSAHGILAAPGGELG